MLNLLLFQDANAGVTIPLWIAIVTGIFALVGPVITAYVTSRINKPQTQVAIENEAEKAEKTRIENERAKLDTKRERLNDIQRNDDVFKTTVEIIETKNTEILKLQNDKLQMQQDFTQQLRSKDIQIMELQGGKAGAIEDRNIFLQKLEKLEDDLDKERIRFKEDLEQERTECNLKIKQLSDKVSQVKKVLSENNIDFNWSDD